MALGPGKYDKECELVRVSTNAECAIVIIVNGEKGSGFSMQSSQLLMIETVPELLENIARQLKEDREGLTKND